MKPIYSQTQFGLTQALMDATFAGEMKLFDQEIEDLVAKNNQIYKVTCNGFFMEGFLYGKPTIGVKAKVLDKSLWNDFYKILEKDRNERHTTHQVIQHFFVRTVNATISLYELQSLYPSGLHHVLGEFPSLLSPHRVQSDAWLAVQLKASAHIREQIAQKLCLNLIVGF